MSADAIVDLYERHASDYDRDRSRALFERAWIDRFLRHVPQGGTLLDLGCGVAEPIAQYLVERGMRVVGVDASPAMIAVCRQRFPESEWMVQDMRRLTLGRRVDGILAWDSLFHLTMDDQRAMFARVAHHARPGAPFLFTSGPAAGEAHGVYHGEPLFHASLDPAEYRERLAAQGFTVQAFQPDDVKCGGHTVWLATAGTSEPVDDDG